MRAIFLCPNLQGGGAERHWSILLPGLRSLGIEVSLATLDGRGEFYALLERDGIPVRCFADHGRRASAIVLRSLRSAKADVIVTRATSADGLGMLAARGSQTRWIANWHRPDNLPLAPRRKLLLRGILPLADGVIAVSDSQVPELFGFGVRRERVHVIHNGTDFPDARGQRASKRAELGLGEKDVAVLLAGRLEPQKRVDLFLDALALAQREHPEVAGLVAGGGPLEAELRRQAEADGVAVRFLGRREDMAEVIAAADMLALSSDREALPYVVLEAMAGGLPIVATAVGAIPEVVTADVGAVVAPGDPYALAAAIGKLASDDNLRSQLGAAGRARQQRFYSSEVMCRLYADAIVSVVYGED